VNREISESQPEGLTVHEASRFCGLGRTKIYEAISEGLLKARKYGKRTIILRTELQEFLRNLPVAR
jgi:excisionase family DNA binding protein